MSRWRKKPIVIEATQWFKPGDHPKVGWGETADNVIQTLEGEMQVSPGDWIITGVAGEVYPCKPDIFEKTYDPVQRSHDIVVFDDIGLELTPAQPLGVRPIPTPPLGLLQRGLRAVQGIFDRHQ